MRECRRWVGSGVGVVAALPSWLVRARVVGTLSSDPALPALPRLNRQGSQATYLSRPSPGKAEKRKGVAKENIDHAADEV